MTDEQLAAIQARAAAATPGPWRFHRQPIDDDVALGVVTYSITATTIVGKRLVAEIETGEVDQRTAEFIAHARDDIPELVAEVRRLRDENERLESAIDFMGRTGLTREEL